VKCFFQLLELPFVGLDGLAKIKAALDVLKAIGDHAGQFGLKPFGWAVNSLVCASRSPLVTSLEICCSKYSLVSSDMDRKVNGVCEGIIGSDGKSVKCVCGSVCMKKKEGTKPCSVPPYRLHFPLAAKAKCTPSDGYVDRL